jgi:hypothetical protein
MGQSRKAPSRVAITNLGCSLEVSDESAGGCVCDLPPHSAGQGLWEASVPRHHHGYPRRLYGALSALFSNHFMNVGTKEIVLGGSQLEHGGQTALNLGVCRCELYQPSDYSV